jgi:OOP family OmpA-OmpF porin
VVEGFAQARFGTAETTSGIRIDDAVPQAWTPRVLAGLDALGYLAEGGVTITPDTVAVRGDTGSTEARREIARLLSQQLGGGASFEIDVTYTQEHDPDAGLPSPGECVQLIRGAAAEQKITFAPSSAEFDPASRETLDRIGDILRTCGPIPMEIAGYTDSQGREEMNLDLSQQRADAVLTALMSRRILTSGITAKGYGEADPIADNDSEDGREANRRIEFHLILPESDYEEAATGPH